MRDSKNTILICNDDGFRSKGINALIDMLADMARLIVCAPEEPRSGYSCAFSANIPLRLTQRRRDEGVEIWSCNGTPVDCVKIALDQFFAETKPDMIIGGINHGDNASVNAHYSGTVGIAVEGCMKYIPSVAFSLCDYRSDADFAPMRPLVRTVTQRVLDEGLPRGVCLNVNYPLTEHYRGVKICRMAHGTWGNECAMMRHPHGYDYFWMTGRYTNDEPEAVDTDNWALTHGYAAITPTTIDLTAHEAIKLLSDWHLS